MDLNSINLLHNGKYLVQEDEEKSLSTLQFIENDLVLLQMKPKASNIKSSDFEIMYINENVFLYTNLLQN